MTVRVPFPTLVRALMGAVVLAAALIAPAGGPGERAAHRGRRE
jgi:hypothetical protein